MTSAFAVYFSYVRLHGKYPYFSLNKLGGHFDFILIFPYNLFHGGEPIISGITLRQTNTWFKYKLLLLK